MRLLVCGGRNYTDKDWVFHCLDEIHKEHPISCIIHGGARGADGLSGQWALSNGIDLEVYPADWDLYGKAAGAIRNKQMLVEGKPDWVYAFPGGKGTGNMIRQAEEANVRVMINFGKV